MSLLLPSLASTTTPRASSASNSVDSIIVPHLHVYDETDPEAIKAVNPQNLNDLSLLRSYPMDVLFPINSNWASKHDFKKIIRHSWIKEGFHCFTKTWWHDSFLASWLTNSYQNTISCWHYGLQMQRWSSVKISVQKRTQTPS